MTRPRLATAAAIVLLASTCAIVAWPQPQSAYPAGVGPSIQGGAGGASRSYSPHLMDGLYQYWTLDEDTTDDRFSSISPGLSTSRLNANGTIPVVAGIRGNAASVSIGNFLDIGIAHLVPTGPFSLAWWMKPSSYTESGANDVPIFVTNSTADAFDFVRRNGTTTFRFTPYPSGSVVGTSGDLIPTGSWHLVIVTFSGNGGVSTLRIDNGTTFTGAAALNFLSSTGQLYISYGSTTGWAGAFDELASFNRVITTAEQDWVWNGGAGRTFQDYMRY